MLQPETPQLDFTESNNNNNRGSQLNESSGPHLQSRQRGPIEQMPLQDFLSADRLDPEEAEPESTVIKQGI